MEGVVIGLVWLHKRLCSGDGPAKCPPNPGPEGGVVKTLAADLRSFQMYIRGYHKMKFLRILTTKKELILMHLKDIELVQRHI